MDESILISFKLCEMSLNWTAEQFFPAKTYYWYFGKTNVQVHKVL